MTLMLEARNSSSSPFIPRRPSRNTPQSELTISCVFYSGDKQYSIWLEGSTDCPVTITTISDVDVPKTDFQRQKEAFLNARQAGPLFLSPYQGQFVVSHDGVILDSDMDLPTLTSRFFERNPGLSVYITKVGPTVRHVFATPPEHY